MFQIVDIPGNLRRLIWGLQKKRVLLLSHAEKECGVYQFGRDLFSALGPSTRYDFVYREVSSKDDIEAAIKSSRPSAILVNWHPATMGRFWTPDLFTIGIPVVGVLHEINERLANALDDKTFHFYMTHDPAAKISNPIVYQSGRLIPAGPKCAPRAPDRFTVGSFGFATPGKGFEDLVSAVHSELDECLIRLHISYSHFFDPDGVIARDLARQLANLVTKPGVELEITHEFRSIEQIVEFLSQNTINAFFYKTGDDRGISSAVDVALAARRPIALRRTTMFRHLFSVTPSIFVEDRPIKEIAEDPVDRLAPLRALWTHEAVRKEYEFMLDRILRRVI